MVTENIHGLISLGEPEHHPLEHHTVLKGGMGMHAIEAGGRQTGNWPSRGMRRVGWLEDQGVNSGRA